MSHITYRQTITWGTYGKNGDEPLREILIKDISDDHLNNIIPFIAGRILFYGEDILKLMIEERNYRMTNGISVPDYIQLNKFKFFKS